MACARRSCIRGASSAGSSAASRRTRRRRLAALVHRRHARHRRSGCRRAASAARRRRLRTRHLLASAVRRARDARRLARVGTPGDDARRLRRRSRWLRRRMVRQRAVARLGVRAGAAGDLRRARPARRAAAGAATVDRVHAADRASSRSSAGRSWRAVCARSCSSSGSASTRVAARAAGAGDSRVLLRHLLPASAGFLQDAGVASRAGVHPGGGHAVLRRSRISRTPCRRGERCCRMRRTWRCSATRRGRWPRRREFSSWFSASTCWRRAKGARLYNWSHEALHGHLHAHRHALLDPTTRVDEAGLAAQRDAVDEHVARPVSSCSARTARRLSSTMTRPIASSISCVSTCPPIGRSSPAPDASPRGRRSRPRDARRPPASTRCSSGRRRSSSRR